MSFQEAKSHKEHVEHCDYELYFGNNLPKHSPSNLLMEKVLVHPNALPPQPLLSKDNKPSNSFFYS